MICEHIELTVESLDDRDIAKAMLKFWLYQSEQARQRFAAATHQRNHAIKANEEATKEWRESDEFGFGPHLPFSESEIAHWGARLPALERNWNEAKAMAGYIINYITDRAH